MRAQGVQLSIIIPAYNEATRLEKSLIHVADYLEAKPYRAEIVVVDDGSEDDTLAVVKRVSERPSVPVRGSDRSCHASPFSTRFSPHPASSP